MELDEQAQRIYPTLDDSTLLSLLLVLRSERDRHFELLKGIGEAYRETVGGDLPSAGSFAEVLERMDASRRPEDDSPDLLEFVRGLVREGGEDPGEQLNDPARWQTFFMYSAVVAAREQWVMQELTRRGLLPPMG